MKKFILLSAGFIILSILLMGCNGGDREGLHGNDSDFVGIWTTGAGSFTMGDSIRLKKPMHCTNHFTLLF